jgi:hypothetical protein
MKTIVIVHHGENSAQMGFDVIEFFKRANKISTTRPHKRIFDAHK